MARSVSTRSTAAPVAAIGLARSRHSQLLCVWPPLSELVDGECALLVDGEPVLVRQGRRYACTFHPELTDDLRVHAALLEA